MHKSEPHHPKGAGESHDAHAEEPKAERPEQTGQPVHELDGAALDVPRCPGGRDSLRLCPDPRHRRSRWPEPPLPSPPGGGSLIPPGAQPKRQAQHGAHHPQLAQTEAASAKDEPKDVQDQYAERIKAVRKLQVQAQGELEARLATLNIDLGTLATKNIDNAQAV